MAVKTFKMEALELIGIIGHNLIERSNHSDIKGFFDTNIDVTLNREYINYDIRKNEFLKRGSYAHEFILIDNVPYYYEYTENIADFKYPSSMLANINNTKSNLIKLHFDLDESNSLQFDIFKIQLRYTSQADGRTQRFSAFAINLMKVNNKGILFSDFCEYLDKYHVRFLGVLNQLIKDIRDSKVLEAKYNEDLEMNEYERRRKEVLSFIN